MTAVSDLVLSAIRAVKASPPRKRRRTRAEIAADQDRRKRASASQQESSRRREATVYDMTALGSLCDRVGLSGGCGPSCPMFERPGCGDG
jgi:hypothetical protein